MPRLHMFVEGTTEQVFADTVLKPHLANHGVYLHRAQCWSHTQRRKDASIVVVGGASVPCKMTLTVASKRTPQRMRTLRRW